MSASEHNYYLKDGLLYKLNGVVMHSVSKEEVLNDGNKYALIIDDTYFFYVGMENVSTSAKKLQGIAANYLNVLFPSDMIKEYGVFHHSSKTIIYVINQSLVDIVAENLELFMSFKKVSTPFLEECIRYNEFVFSDGDKKYKLSNNLVSLTEDSDVDFITAKDYFDSMTNIKYSIYLPGVVRKSAMKLPLVAPAMLLGLVYIILIISSVSEIFAYNKVNKYYDEALAKVYQNAGVASSQDPYGSILQQSRLVSASGGSERILNVLNNLNIVNIEGVVLENINIRDDDVRVSGTATTFAQVDEIKKLMENKLQNSINVDDTQKVKDGISFTMRYTKSQK